ncbi:MAG: polysaccharide biosynthesis protein [Acidobacteria bacterium]|nr:polysaccharide biosynthesis protein [Acidobacteriota bacterium]
MRRRTKHRYLLNIIVQLSIFAGAGIGAFLLRFEFSVPRNYVPHLLVALPVWMAVKSAVYSSFGLHRAWWRFFSLADATRLAAANGFASVVSTLLLAALAPAGFPRSIPVIDFLLCLIASGAVFGAARVMSESAAGGAQDGARRILIYGAGEAGVMLLRETRMNSAVGYSVQGFIDDDPGIRDLTVRGVRVLGSGSELKWIVRRDGIDEVVIAMPSATSGQLVRVLDACSSAGVPFRTLPTLAEVVEGRAQATEVRGVDVKDLLSRQPVRLNQLEIQRKLQDRVVLITGAAGSIGSELARQVARFGPSAIVGFEIAETALFQLEREMQATHPGVRFHPEIGSVQNSRRIADVLKRYRPSVVFHAAAYKHVPMMESQIFEAVENNVLGTYCVALAAREHQVDDFVLISSDKAVRPVSVMGATKRLDEMLVLSMQNHGTRFAAVRFGNVLGSNGSVIPLFKQQIASGGPVTVTDPRMQRYFMTIPEAAQLVLQAAAMGAGGEIFLLDMGQPIKIADLARNLILLSGLRPGVDIKIEFTGARPGERLYEELNFHAEETLPTPHEKIKIFAGGWLPAGDMIAYVRRLRSLCDDRDAPGLVLLLKELIPEYNPSSHLLQQVLADETAGKARAAAVRPLYSVAGR